VEHHPGLGNRGFPGWPLQETHPCAGDAREGFTASPPPRRTRDAVGAWGSPCGEDTTPKASGRDRDPLRCPSAGRARSPRGASHTVPSRAPGPGSTHGLCACSLTLPAPAVWFDPILTILYLLASPDVTAPARDGSPPLARGRGHAVC
jgi:hypothetical protein